MSCGFAVGWSYAETVWTVASGSASLLVIVSRTIVLIPDSSLDGVSMFLPFVEASGWIGVDSVVVGVP